MSIDFNVFDRGNFAESERRIEKRDKEIRIIAASARTPSATHRSVYFQICSIHTCNLVYCGPNRPITSARSS